jgi:hypothetical protein
LSKTFSWVAITVTTFFCLSLLEGCGSVRLYSEARDKQGAAAKDAWSEVDPSTVISTERTNLKNLLDLELQTQDQLATGIRDHELRSIVEAATVEAGLVKSTSARLSQLIGAPENFQKSLERLGKRDTNSNRVEDTRETLKNLNIQPPECSQLVGGVIPADLRTSIDALPSARAPLALEAAQRLIKECAVGDSTAEAYSLVAGSSKNELNKALEQYKQDIKDLGDLQSKAAELENEYKTASTAYNDAVKTAQSNSNSLSDVQAKAKDLHGAVVAIENAGNAFSVKFLSEQRLSSIEKFFKAITETKPGDPLPENANQAAAAFVIIPNLLDDAHKALADAKKPLALPLLIRRNYEQLNLEAANRDIATRQSMAKLSAQWADAVYADARQLWMASRDFKGAGVTRYYRVSVLSAFSKQCPRETSTDRPCRDDKEKLYAGAARYLDAVGRLEANRYKLQYMHIAAVHERSLAYAEVNMKQWQSLIDATVIQVADYSAGGIKAEQITALLNAAGVSAIAAGVNK